MDASMPQQFFTISPELSSDTPHSILLYSSDDHSLISSYFDEMSIGCDRPTFVDLRTVNSTSFEIRLPTFPSNETNYITLRLKEIKSNSSLDHLSFFLAITANDTEQISPSPFLLPSAHPTLAPFPSESNWTLISSSLSPSPSPSGSLSLTPLPSSIPSISPSPSRSPSPSSSPSLYVLFSQTPLPSPSPSPSASSLLPSPSPFNPYFNKTEGKIITYNNSLNSMMLTLENSLPFAALTLSTWIENATIDNSYDNSSFQQHSIATAQARTLFGNKNKLDFEPGGRVAKSRYIETFGPCALVIIHSFVPFLFKHLLISLVL